MALLAAIVMTLLNAFEPPTVDDVAHYYYARQVAHDPLHPYEFVIEWHQHPVPAWDVMVPPVYPYLWAPSIAWFGDSPALWRVWLMPLSWLFCGSLLALLRRYAPRHATPLLLLVALGPTVLPGINNMLELPMLAFGLAAFARFHTALERRCVRTAIVSGALLGIALQTKYSALALFGPWILLGLLRRRPRELAASLLTTAAVAGGIEGLLALSHGGGSYFLHCLSHSNVRDWHHVLIGMFLQIGVLGMPTALLAMFALRVPRSAIALVCIVYAAAHATVALAPHAPDESRLLAPDSLAYLAMALCTWGTLAVLYARLGMPALRELPRLRPTRAAATRLFLCGWLAGEIAASLLISPFPAARRVLTIVLATTFAAAWLAAHRRGGTGVVRAIAATSVLLGLAYQGVDVIEGRAAEQAAHEAMAYATGLSPAPAAVYFTGGWAFEYAAPRVGLRPLLQGVTALHTGDIVVTGSIDGIEVPWFQTDPRLRLLHEVDIEDRVPLSTLFHYYSGRRPFDGQHGPRYIARIYRVTSDLEPGALHPRLTTPLGTLVPEPAAAQPR